MSTPTNNTHQQTDHFRGNDAYGAYQGARPTNQITHSQCQYQTTTTVIRQDNTTYKKVTTCPNIAVFNPGYNRACPAHIIPTLLDTIDQYTHRFDDVNTITNSDIFTRHEEECKQLTLLATKLIKLLPKQPKTGTKRGTETD